MKRIVVAACKRDNGVICSVERPGRHDTILNALYNSNVSSPQRPDQQGFLTNEGEFVNRKEAYKIAVASGQFDYKGPNKRLYSEDLW